MHTNMKNKAHKKCGIKKRGDAAVPNSLPARCPACLEHFDQIRDALGQRTACCQDP